ncbi:MAG: hypothetical protein B7Y39_17645 [Bdellovibrio sp. 28-41-41]|nr:MAG: hypothetical protein B7Y39_17645 [Bdellovibrio sp. 28-41-41]
MNFIFVIHLLASTLFTILSIAPKQAAAASDIPNQETLDHLRHEGQFFSIQITKDDPIRIFVVGREEAKFDQKKLSLTVRRLKPYPGKTLTVDRFDNYFSVNDTKEFKKTTDLEIVTKMDDKEDVFKIKLKNTKP